MVVVANKGETSREAGSQKKHFLTLANEVCVDSSCEFGTADLLLTKRLHGLQSWEGNQIALFPKGQ